MSSLQMSSTSRRKLALSAVDVGARSAVAVVMSRAIIVRVGSLSGPSVISATGDAATKAARRRAIRQMSLTILAT